MRLLLISNSTNAGEAYLDYPKYNIRDFLGSLSLDCLFIPYAGVTISFDDYEARVKERFAEVGHRITSVHHASDPIAAVQSAEAIVVGGGNTFQLIKMIQEFGLINPVRERVLGGTPFVGWSAGSNVCCPTIRTTNDMPILEPESFNAFNLIPFQINPHYTDLNPPGHAGETREDRIMEYLAANPGDTVLGLREGCMFTVEGKQMKLTGERPVRLFRFNQTPIELDQSHDFSEFLE
ncbi:MAG: dipeptidase PepE [Bacteroidetes bacterium]|nr:MAG: dipeptidase PepE [Bacteroidota bacterium]RLD72094.1 MAG: dipeptidase PepE [Bacteroidota bacterium]RLD95795.1 MAG: dipeptidase PepE [Bacteroidota bacterium]